VCLVILGERELFVNGRPAQTVGVSFALNVPMFHQRRARKIDSNVIALDIATAVGARTPPHQVAQPKRKQQVESQMLEARRRQALQCIQHVQTCCLALGCGV